MDGLDVNVRNTHDFVQQVDVVCVTFKASFSHPSSKQIVYDTNFIEHLSPQIKDLIDTSFDEYRMHVELNVTPSSDEPTTTTSLLPTPTQIATSREVNESLGSTRRVMHEHHFHGQVCAVCHSNYKLNEFVRTLPICKHYFHKRCIDPWIKKNHTPTCPICRALISHPNNLTNPINHPHPLHTDSGRTPSPAPECHSVGSPRPDSVEHAADPSHSPCVNA